MRPDYDTSKPLTPPFAALEEALRCRVVSNDNFFTFLLGTLKRDEWGLPRADKNGYVTDGPEPKRSRGGGGGSNGGSGSDGGGGAAARKCELVRLRGHEDSVLRLVSVYLSVPIGRALRNLRDARRAVAALKPSTPYSEEPHPAVS